MTKIEKRRVKKGLSRRQLADRVGVSERVIYYYESGREPKASILKKIAKVLGCLMEDLI
ncbi:MAG: helix-turn-helix transcriptional regulator [Clostridia bacterium]|nr:helix-turn-helix transcriptional regulator [Clostridia bacterium]